MSLHWISRDEWKYIQQFREAVKKHPVFSRYSPRSRFKPFERSVLRFDWRGMNAVLEQREKHVPWSVLMEEVAELYECRMIPERALSEIRDCITVLTRMAKAYEQEECK